jgi:hypothetical protein
MTKRRLLVLFGAVAGFVALVRRRRAGGPHVDLYYEDGSMVSLRGSPEAARMLAVARGAVRAVRG